MIERPDSNIDINYYQEAFINPFNLTFLTVSTIVFIFLSFILDYFTNPLGLAAILLALEVFVVNALAANKRFRKAVKLKKLAEIEEANKKQLRSPLYILKSLDKPLQLRYMSLRKNIQQIRTNLSKSINTSEALLDTYYQKLYELEKLYLHLLYNWQKCKEFTSDNKNSELQTEILKLELEIPNDTEVVKKIKTKRLEILRKRLNRINKVIESIEIMKVQIDTVEDNVKFLLEQSFTIKDPADIANQVSEIINETEYNQDILTELESVMGVDETMGYNLGTEQDKSLKNRIKY
ncbi:MAG: hypothetical protein NZ455_10870 [Bacteroidia bacterium]|nr:hypothetical protein [Bacteroidia bacterium]MDW8348280.1 hypothetical protein [Bacteroidia bacterium]